MTVIENKSYRSLFDRGEVGTIEHLEFRHCEFRNCGLSLTPVCADRTVCRDVRLYECSAINCWIGPALLEEMIISGLETNQLLIAWGPLFKHVTIEGNIGEMKVIES